MMNGADEKERMLILLVDDEEEYRQLLGEFLRHKGCEVVEAATSQAALELASHPDIHFDVALIDYTIEGSLDCVQLIKALREVQPQMDTIILTAYEESDMIEAMQAGAYRSFEKRIGPEAIFNVAQMIVINQRERASHTVLEQANQISGIMLELSEKIATLQPETIFQAAADALSKLFRNVDIEIIRLEKKNWMIHYEKVLHIGTLLSKPKRILYPEGKTDVAVDWVLNHRSTYSFSDYPQDNTPQEGCPEGLFLESIAGEEPRSWIGVPLVADEVALGAICISSCEANRFSSSDRWVLMAIAQHVSQALNNMLLYQETKIINSISWAIATKKELSDLLDTIVEQIEQLLDIQNLRIGIYNKLRNQTDILVRYDQGKRIEPLSLPMNVGLTSYTIRTGESVLGHTRAEIEAFENEKDIKPSGASAVSWLSAPLIGPDGKRVGAIALQDYNREHAYDERDRELLKRISAHLAVAVTSAQLFNQVELNMAQRQTLSELTDRIHRYSDTFDQDWKWDFLTGVTAGYGLRFNRALLFRWEPQQGNNPGRGNLVGCAGIGDLTKESAESTWARMKQDDADSIRGYQDRPASEIRDTPVNRALQGMVLVVSEQSNDLLSQVVFGEDADPRIGSQDAFPADMPLITQFTLDEFAIVPIFQDGKIRYVLVVDNLFTRQPITAESLEQLKSFAGTVMTIVEKFNINEQLRQRAETLNQLYEISQRIAAAKSGDNVLQFIVDETMKLTGAHCVVMYPYRAETQTYDVPNIKARGLQHDWNIKSKKRTERSLSEKIRSAKKVIVDDVSSGWDNSHQVGIYKKDNGFRDREGIRSFAGVLLSVKGQDVGMLFVSYRKLHAFLEKEVELIQSIGNLAAVTIVKNRLDRQKDALLTSQMITREGLSDIQHMVLRAKEHDGHIWDKILDKCIANSGASAGWVLNVTPDGGQMKILAARSGGEIADIEETRGLIQELSKERTLVRVNNMRLSRRWRKWFQNRPWVNSFLSVNLEIPQRNTDHGVVLIYLESFSANAFDDDTRELMKELANAAALVAKQTDLFKESSQKSRSLSGQLTALEAISQETQEHKILDVILGQAVKLSNIDGQKAEIGILYRRQGDCLVPECWRTSGKRPRDKRKIYIRSTEDVSDRQPMGICEWVAIHKEICRLPDDEGNTHILTTSGAGSELAAPLIQNETGELEGVLYLGHPSKSGFSLGDEQTLASFSKHAEITIQMSRKRDELATNQMIGYANYLGGTLYHGIRGYVYSIRNTTFELKRIYAGENINVSPSVLFDEIQESTNEIMRLYESLRLFTKTHVNIMELLNERISRLKSTYRSTNIIWEDIKVEPNAEKAFVYINREAIDQVINIVVDNAIEAMKDMDVQKLMISVSTDNTVVFIEISDTGPGIDHTKIDKLYRTAMHEENNPTRGIGASIAGIIMRGMNGGVKVYNRSPNGASIVLSLPIDV